MKESISCLIDIFGNRSFSHDVTAAILVYQNNETAAMLVVYQTDPVGVETLFICVFKLSFVPINLHGCWPRE